MSRKKSVQIVTEKEPPKSEPPSVPELPSPAPASRGNVEEKPVQTPTAETAPEVKCISIIEIIKDLPEDKVNMAEGLGVPIRPILAWAYQMEMQQKQIIEILKKWGEQIKAGQPVMVEKTQAPAQGGGGGGIGKVLENPILKEFVQAARQQGLLGGGGAEDPFVAQLKANMIRSGMETMEFQQKIGKAVMDKILVKVVGEVVP